MDEGKTNWLAHKVQIFDAIKKESKFFVKSIKKKELLYPVIGKEHFSQYFESH